MANGSKTFLISYSVYVEDEKGNVTEISGKEIKVKNQLNELGAKIGLEDYLKKKYPNFHHLYISNCHEDFSNYNGLFSKWFGGDTNNPFSDLFSK